MHPLKIYWGNAEKILHSKTMVHVHLMLIHCYIYKVMKLHSVEDQILCVIFLFSSTFLDWEKNCQQKVGNSMLFWQNQHSLIVRFRY